MPFDSNTVTALQAGALVLADFLTIHGWDGDGDATDYCYWTREGNVTTNVVDARDGSTDSRDFIGDGALLEVPPVVDGIGFEARALSFGLNPRHASVRDMAFGGRIRLARVELHRGLFDPATGALVSTPFPYFLGRVDGLSTTAGGVGADGQAAEATMTLDVVADTIDLTRTNPALKSDEQQRLRSGDRIRCYADPAGQYEVRWGTAEAND